MKTPPFICLSAAMIIATATLSLPDARLVGRWHGNDRFFGLSHEEGSAAQGMAQYVETDLTISGDGAVAGHIGGAELSACAIEANRGWLGRMLHLKTDYIIRGKIVGRVSSRSEDGVHVISAPLNLDGDELSGSVFVIRGAVTYPYPFLRLQLTRH